METVIIVEMINAVLLISLLFVYVNNYLQMKTVFGLGLILFASVLLLQNLIAVYFHFAMVEFYSSEVLEHAAIINFVQMTALIIINWVTWKD